MALVPGRSSTSSEEHAAIVDAILAATQGRGDGDAAIAGHPEASRLLRPGGELVFLLSSLLFMLCTPDDEDLPAADRLLRSYFDMHRFEWPDDDSVEFHIPTGR
jgi:hypothetical protein